MMSELAKINACAKRPIDVWTNYLYYPLSIRLVYLLRNTSVTPNGITLFSLILCLAGCGFFGVGTHSTEITGLILVQLSYVFDCADGQLARYRQQFSPIGGWMDQIADRIKEFSVYFSLAYGYTRYHTGSMWVWKWAFVALFTLYLLEYFGQVHFTPRNADVPSLPGAIDLDGRLDGAAQAQSEQAATVEKFQKAQSVRSLIPFRGFIIGEQYFVLLVFLVFNAVVPLLFFVSVLGMLMCVYRPTVQLYKWHRGYV